jgi:hypothetical protein
MSRFFVLILVLAVCMVKVCCAQETIVTVENQIGPFNIVGEERMMESQLLSAFGQGHVYIYQVGDEIFQKKHSYYVSDEKLWVEISLSHVLDSHLDRTVDSILVTKKELCEKKFRPKKSFGPLITSKGITIGDPIDKVLNAYGKPSESIVISKDKLFSELVEDLELTSGKVLIYFPDELFFEEFYFDAEGLHSLLVSRIE